MTTETYDKRFHIPLGCLKYVHDPKVIWGKNGKLYHIRLDKKGHPIAKLLVAEEIEGTPLFDKEKLKVAEKRVEDELINFT